MGGKSRAHGANYDFLLGFCVFLIGGDLAPVCLVNMHDLRQEAGKRRTSVSARTKGQNRKGGKGWRAGEVGGRGGSELTVCVSVCPGSPGRDHLTRIRAGSCSISL